jgi:hypothetical protein
MSDLHGPHWWLMHNSLISSAMVWKWSEGVPQSSCAGCLVPSVAVLRSGGTFKRWGLMEGYGCIASMGLMLACHQSKLLQNETISCPWFSSAYKPFCFSAIL